MLVRGLLAVKCGVLVLLMLLAAPNAQAVVIVEGAASSTGNDSDLPSPARSFDFEAAAADFGSHLASEASRAPLITAVADPNDGVGATAAAPVPEPSALLLFGLGGATLFVRARRRR